MRRVVVALCFIPVHSPNPLLWVKLNALRATVPNFELGTEQQMQPHMTKTNYSVTTVIGHDILGETCWKLQGCPTRGRGGCTGGGFRPRAHHTSTVETTTPTLDISSSTTDIGRLSEDEVEALRRLMSRLDTPATAASSSALTGNLTTALNASATPPDASDHMTDMSPLFSSYNPCSGRDKVRIADGSLSPVSGKRSVSVTPSMTLASVLHVPNLAANLLSIARITSELNCRVIFYSYYCFFKDLAIGKMIGSGSLKDGLYYLDSQPDTHGWLIQAYHTVQADDSAARIWF